VSATLIQIQIQNNKMQIYIYFKQQALAGKLEMHQAPDSSRRALSAQALNDGLLLFTSSPAT
jgi:hypothetical protein